MRRAYWLDPLLTDVRYAARLLAKHKGFTCVAVLTALGISVGLAASALAMRLMSSLLFGVSTGDPITFASVVTLLATVAVVACLIPARRATRISPAQVLRG